MPMNGARVAEIMLLLYDYDLDDLPERLITNFPHSHG